MLFLLQNKMFHQKASGAKYEFKAITKIVEDSANTKKVLGQISLKYNDEW